MAIAPAGTDVLDGNAPHRLSQTARNGVVCPGSPDGVTGIVLVPTMFRQNWAGLQNPPPGMDLGVIEIGKKFLSSLVAAQLAVGVMFAVFVTWALVVRKTDSGMHKRLMILATVLPLPAARLTGYDGFPRPIPPAFCHRQSTQCFGLRR